MGVYSRKTDIQRHFGKLVIAESGRRGARQECNRDKCQDNDDATHSMVLFDTQYSNTDITVQCGFGYNIKILFVQFYEILKIHVNTCPKNS